MGGFSWGGRRGLSVGGVGELMKRLSEEFSSNILVNFFFFLFASLSIFSCPHFFFDFFFF